MPVNSYKLDDLAQSLLDRMQRDACGATVQLGMDGTGKAVSVIVAGGTGCTIGVTGAPVPTQSVCGSCMINITDGVLRE